MNQELGDTVEGLKLCRSVDGPCSGCVQGKMTAHAKLSSTKPSAEPCHYEVGEAACGDVYYLERNRTVSSLTSSLALSGEIIFVERPKCGVARDLSGKAEWAVVISRAMDGTGILPWRSSSCTPCALRTA